MGVVMSSPVGAGFEGCEPVCFRPGGTGRLQHDLIPSRGQRGAEMLAAWRR